MLSVEFTYICPYIFICSFDKVVFLVKIFVLFTHLHNIYMKSFCAVLCFSSNYLLALLAKRLFFLITIGLDIKLVEAKNVDQESKRDYIKSR